MVTQDRQKPRRPRPVFRTVRVSRVNRVTPHMVRVTVTGEELEGFTTRGPAEHIKVFFPAPGQEKPVLPEWGPDGPVYAEGQSRPTSRTYTPRRWNPSARELTIDFVLHGDGPGSNWAERARLGDVVVVAGPGGAYQLDAEADWYVIAGDDTAVPAIGTILEALPASAHAAVYIEAPDATAEQRLDSPARVEVTWLHRGTEPGVAGRLLATALREVPLPEGHGRVWVACEASVMRDIRRHLLSERGLDRGAIHTHGYWKVGVANHPDHDLGDDV